MASDAPGSPRWHCVTRMADSRICLSGCSDAPVDIQPQDARGGKKVQSTWYELPYCLLEISSLKIAPTPAGEEPLHALAAADGVGEDVAVGVFDVAAGGEAAGEAGDLDVRETRDEGLDVQGGAVAFKGGVGGHDHFADRSRVEALDESVEREVGGIDA